MISKLIRISLGLERFELNSFINDEVFDQGLDYLDAATGVISICTTEPTTYAQATQLTTESPAGLSLGEKTGLNIGATQNGVTDGRRVIVPAITDGSVQATGTAAFWALTDGASVLLATGALSSSQAVTAGNTFTLDAISITIRDAA